MAEIKCALPSELNECPYFVREGSTCSKEFPHPCGMLKVVELETPKRYEYKREERWYEKYYRRRRENRR